MHIQMKEPKCLLKKIDPGKSENHNKNLWAILKVILLIRSEHSYQNYFLFLDSMRAIKEKEKCFSSTLENLHEFTISYENEKTKIIKSKFWNGFCRCGFYWLMPTQDYMCLWGKCALKNVFIGNFPAHQTNEEK